MNPIYKIIIFLTAFFSVTTFAESKIQVTCTGTDVSVVGTLNLSESGELSGEMMTTGSKIPETVTGMQTYTGNYSFIKAGSYYQNYDYEVLTLRAVSTTDIFFIKSFVTINGTLEQTIFINSSPNTVSCHFVGL